jgi:hypothetical protein
MQNWIPCLIPWKAPKQKRNLVIKAKAKAKERVKERNKHVDV